MIDYANSLFNAEAEQAVVGAFFLEAALLEDCFLKPDYFHSKSLRTLFQAICELDGEGKAIDPLTVMEKLGPAELERIGGLTYILELADSVPTVTNFSYYQGIVYDYYQKRRVIEIALTMIEEVKHEGYELAVEKGINRFMMLEQEDCHENAVGDIVGPLIEIYDECETERDDLIGISTGFEELDALTGGFRGGDLVVVGARPSVGKTALALHFAAKAAEEHVCLYVSLEMEKKQLLRRMIATIGRISSKRLEHPVKYFSETDWQRLSYSLGKLCGSSLRIIDEPGLDLAAIRRYARKLRREFGPEKKLLIIVDYLQLLGGGDFKKQARHEEVAEISRGLKILARKLNATVLAISQLSRAVEMRHNKRPMLSDLRESGQIEQDADLIALLYREDYYTRDTNEENVLEVILAKHRNGPIGTIKLNYERDYGCFEPIASRKK